MARLNTLGNLNNIIIVKVEAYDGEVRLRVFWLLLNRYSLFLIIKFYYSVAFRVRNFVGKNCAAIWVVASLKAVTKGFTIEDIVTKY